MKSPLRARIAPSPRKVNAQSISKNGARLQPSAASGRSPYYKPSYSLTGDVEHWLSYASRHPFWPIIQRMGKGRSHAYVCGLCHTYGVLTRACMMGATHRMSMADAITRIAQAFGMHPRSARRRIERLIKFEVLARIDARTIAFTKGVPMRLGSGPDARRVEIKEGDPFWRHHRIARREAARLRQQAYRARKRHAQRLAAMQSGAQKAAQSPADRGAKRPAAAGSGGQCVTPNVTLTPQSAQKNSTNAGTYERVTTVIKKDVGAHAPTRPKTGLTHPPPTEAPRRLMSVKTLAQDTLRECHVAYYASRRPTPSVLPAMSEAQIVEVELDLASPLQSRQNQKQPLKQSLLTTHRICEAPMTHGTIAWPQAKTRSETEVFALLRQMQAMSAQRALERAAEATPDPEASARAPRPGLAVPLESPPTQTPAPPPPGEPPSGSSPPTQPSPSPAQPPPSAARPPPHPQATPKPLEPPGDALRAYLAELDPDDAWRLNIGSLLNLGASPEVCRQAMRITREAAQNKAAAGRSLRNPGGYCFKTAKALLQGQPGASEASFGGDPPRYIVPLSF